MEWEEIYGARSLRPEKMANEPEKLDGVVERVLTKYSRNQPVTDEDVRRVFGGHPEIFEGLSGSSGWNLLA